MKNIVLLGASGSIGLQTIDVVKAHSDLFHIEAISIGKNISVLRNILKEIDVKIVCVAKKEDMDLLEKEYKEIKFVCGESGLMYITSLETFDTLVNALVGFVGLKPTLNAINNNKDIALANKETLVVGGSLVKAAIKEHNVHLYPIDSEHSAIFQCLRGNDSKEVDKLIITASGGSFRNLERNQLENVTLEQALNHPNWSMGAKITIDSATMMNKGLEVIEAHYLFDTDYKDIEVLLHQESVVHSMVQYKDTSIIAQLGTADMRLPIQYALNYPNRIELKGGQKLNLAELGLLHFKKIDFIRYPLVKVAIECGKAEGNALAIMNAANECAVNLFLNNKIKFLDIELYIVDALKHIDYKKNVTLEDIIEADQAARTFILNKLKGDS
ncbi:MAG: 1-deoxy-D-xylulose-5-phosphate reductoisomerase [Erysipelotrichaceae bacterium]